MITVMHIVDLPCSNSWLNGVAAHYDRGRFRHLVTSLGVRNGMHSALEDLNLPTFALNATARRHYPVALQRLVCLLRKERVDIVQTHLFEPSFVGLLAAMIARTPLRIVTRHHSDFTTQFGRPVHRWLDRWQAMHADRVMAASEAVKRAMMQHEGVPEGRIAIARYGYDFTKLKPVLSATERAQLRATTGGDAQLLIGCIGRLSIEKGHVYLFQAMKQVISKAPNARLVLVGTGPLLGKLQELAHSLGIEQHTLFLGFRTDAWKLIEAMDLIVHPTLHEAFCSVIIESMALERALITTNVAAAPEQVDHNETGILVPAKDPDALAGAIISVIDDRARAGRMGQEARRRVNERFNFPKMMLEYEACYSEWLSGTNGAHCRN